MGVANVSSDWVSGNLVFYDKDGAVIVTYDGTNRKLTFPSGSTPNIATGGVVTVDGQDISTELKALSNLDAELALLEGITASAAEINLIDGSIAGTAVASKAAVLGASKNLDILGLPVGGLKIGAAGAEVALTADAAELNYVDGVTSAIQTQMNTKGDQKGIITLLMSFAAAELTTTRIYFTSACTINRIRGIVMVAIAATDNGTITRGNSAGASAGGVVTATASDALNTEYGVSPTTNNTVAADSYYYLTSAKTTAGGKVLVTLEYTKD